jgi:hypothetical protein
LPHRGALVGENLHCFGSGVGHIDVPIGVHGHTHRLGETGPLGHILAAIVINRHPRVARVRHVNLARRIHRDPGGIVQLTSAPGTEGKSVMVERIKNRDPVIILVGDKKFAHRIEGYSRSQQIPRGGSGTA